ncbi:MAG: hypothetical protein VB042_08580 [Victivallaceae bacterium]|nr:hypothetical protein [Victivallaceae bacterium]
MSARIYERVTLHGKNGRFEIELEIKITVPDGEENPKAMLAEADKTILDYITQSRVPNNPNKNSTDNTTARQ